MQDLSQSSDEAIKLCMSAYADLAQIEASIELDDSLTYGLRMLARYTAEYERRQLIALLPPARPSRSTRI